MNMIKVGLANVIIAIFGQLFCWGYAVTRHEADTPLSTIIFAIVWNTIPYGFAMVASVLRARLGVLNVLSSLCLCCLAVVYWDALLRPVHSTAGIALLFWPVLHSIGLVVVGAILFLVRGQ